MKRIINLVSTLCLLSTSTPSLANTELDISQAPLTISTSAPPLMMITMARDNKLYQEAYNDATDLDGDGTVDIGYKPTIDYFGYFDSYKCYRYVTSEGGFFRPIEDTADKTCHNASHAPWSGDFLNYLTTSRMDAIRKVLYGGKRSIDTSGKTVLERAFITQDAHSWGKEFFPTQDTGGNYIRDNYNISHYTPYSMPSNGRRHLFASVTLNNESIPKLRVLTNSSIPVSGWVSRDGNVTGSLCTDFTTSTSGNCSDYTSPYNSITDFNVRLVVCRSPSSSPVRTRESNCKAYTSGNTTSYKPTGLLQKYGENDSIYFGLLTGSYEKNMSGGVLRKNISSFAPEIGDNGIFVSSDGIIATLNNLSMLGTSFSSNRGWNGSRWNGCNLIVNRIMNEGECPMWGNPLAEMMYETTRYFAGKASPTSSFTYGDGNHLIDNALNLPKPSWLDPYNYTPPNEATNTEQVGFPQCAKPFQLVISDANPNYDSNSLPGSRFDSFSGDIGTLDVGDIADTIWATETGSESTVKKHFIGESKLLTGITDKDGLPSAKDVYTLGNIRGLSPEEPSKEGSYYSAAIAYFAKNNDLNPADDDQKLSTYVISLASSLPKIEIPTGIDSKVTLVPLGKSVRYNSTINANRGAHQPTLSITDYYAETMTENSGSFVVNFGDVEQGYDNELDSIVRYEYEKLNDGTIQVKVSLLYQQAGIDMHMGYAISGTNQDGVYLDVSNKAYRTLNNQYRSNNLRSQYGDYFADTHPNEYYNTQRQLVTVPGCPYWNLVNGECRSDGFSGSNSYLPESNTRVFTPNTSTQTATVLDEPLKYAAKWGGFNDTNDNNLPDLPSEYEDSTGKIRNYFPVTNASTLGDRLEEAFNSVLLSAGSSSSVAINVGSTGGEDESIFQAVFDSTNWSGDLRARSVTETGFHQIWSAYDILANRDANNRTILTWRRPNTGNGKGIPFRVPDDVTAPDDDEMTIAQFTQLTSTVDDAIKAQFGDNLINYLRGDRTNEGASGFRVRGDAPLGDIVNSDPAYVSRPGAEYWRPWENKQFANAPMPENDTGTPSYFDFITAHRNRTPIVYVGANDGMLHGFNAYTVDNPATANVNEATNAGQEVLAYIPSDTYDNLRDLARQDYSHKPYVDSSPAFDDVLFTSSTTPSERRWRTVLVSGMGGGGRTIFALDITTPYNTTNSNGVSNDDGFSESNAEDIVLWEFRDPDLGLTFGEPSIVRLHNGKWVAIFGNGYNSTNPDGDAFLFIVDIETGELIKKINTGYGVNEDPNNSVSTLGDSEKNRINGLATPNAIDFDDDNIYDYVVAGDLFGNLFVFDLNSTDPDNWALATLRNTTGSNTAQQPLFQARSPDFSGRSQPITTKPLVDVHLAPGESPGQERDLMIFFTTGKYLEDRDDASTGEPTQSAYGISFKGARPAYSAEGETQASAATYAQAVTRSQLLQQNIEAEVTSSGGGQPLRILSNHEICWEDCTQTNGTTPTAPHRGWVMDLVNRNGSVSSTGIITPGNSTTNYGERAVFDPLMDTERMFFSTLLPSDQICDGGGDSWIMGLNKANGGRLFIPPFDANRDRKIDNGDIYNFVAPSGVKKGDIVQITSGTQKDDGTHSIISNGSSGVVSGDTISGSALNQGRQNWRQLQ